MAAQQPFWTRPLASLDQGEWEALCDGCGQCCLHKIEDEDTGELFLTRVACRELDLACIRCRSYDRRFQVVPECLDVRALNPEQYAWLPPSCAYRLRFEGKPLPDWHPLVSGDPDLVRMAGKSVGDWAISETDLPDEDALLDHVIDD